ncbi:methyl-accepting chemotaxis protein [Desulfoplanes formicivorans]|uniref:methyl-accepting chemotaxis protein n=1 Tax=Desulfoplanes formicivorans TaxID=1592317 RepID=UPI0008528DEF|nr:methyl-accepting chemotaxis protein [Desulfoplanes formicivorans]
MRTLQKLVVSIKGRIILLVVFMGIFGGVIFAGMLYTTQEIKQIGLDEVQAAVRVGEKLELKSVVHSTAMVLGTLLRGKSRQEHVQLLKQALDPLRFGPGNEGYFYVYDLSGINVAHPMKPDLVGKNLWGFKDKVGTLLIQDSIRVAKQGGGFVEFFWDKPGTDVLAKKLSYAESIPGTDLWIGTGIYLDAEASTVQGMSDRVDQSSTRSIMIITLLIAAFFLFVVLPLAIFIFRSIARPLTIMTEQVEAVAGGDLNVRFDLSGRDELAVMRRSVARMVDILKERIAFSDGVLDAITMPCAVYNKDNRVMFANEAVCQAIGVTGSAESQIGKTSGEFIYGDASKKTISAEPLRTGFQIHQEVSFVTRQGEKRILDVTSTPLVNEKGEIIAAVALWFDLTTIREQQSLIQKTNEAIIAGTTKAAEISDRVASASEELSAQIEQSSQGAKEQRNRSAESATAMEEMNASMIEVASNASNAAQLAEETRDAAQQGMGVVDEVIQGIKKISSDFKEVNIAFQGLHKQSEAITHIVQVIDDIADQTNLLALNAAIEAARAGDAGRGFAVVADEVRKLAEKTMGATKEVTSSISGMQSIVSKTTEGMAHVEPLIESVIVQSGTADKTLHGIVGKVDQTSQQVVSIATASEEQSAVSEQINHSVEEVNRIAAETADAMDQSAQAVAELAELAQDLNRVMASMREEIG